MTEKLWLMNGKWFKSEFNLQPRNFPEDNQKIIPQKLGLLFHNQYFLVLCFKTGYPVEQLSFKG
jgi:hypothetical protein